MINILVTAIGTISGTTIVQQLRKNKDVFIIGADINFKEYIVSSKDVDEYYRFPSVVDNREYFEFILSFCKEHNIDYIFPIIDEEVELLSKFKDKFEAIGTIPCVLEYEIVKVCRDKYETFSWLKENEPSVYIPTMLVSQFNGEIEYPLFIKPRKGRASIGCREVNSEKELSLIINEITPFDYLVQECCKGDIISADVLRDSKHKTIQVVARKEEIRNKNGAAIAVKIIKDERIENISKNISEKLNINGVINIEFFYDEDSGKYSLIEINPRLPAGTAFTCMAGVDLIDQYLRIMQGMPIIEQKAKINSTFARRYETYATTK